MSKEYNNRQDKPIVNPPFTLEEYEKAKCSHESIKLTGKFETENLACQTCDFKIPF